MIVGLQQIILFITPKPQNIHLTIIETNKSSKFSHF